MLLLHIIVSFSLIAISVFSVALSPEAKSQRFMLIGMLTSSIVTFASGIALILQGGGVARLCIFGAATIALSVYSSRRILAANNIRIEL